MLERVLTGWFVKEEQISSGGGTSSITSLPNRILLINSYHFGYFDGLQQNSVVFLGISHSQELEVKWSSGDNDVSDDYSTMELMFYMMTLLNLLDSWVLGTWYLDDTIKPVELLSTWYLDDSVKPVGLLSTWSTGDNPPSSPAVPPYWEINWKISCK